MKKWIVALAAIAVLLLTVIAGCGAKMPTVAEDSQADQYETKLDFNTEYTIQDQVIETVE